MIGQIFHNSVVFSTFYGDGYSYGFNGMEKDNEHTQGKYDFGARIYDSRLGRWLAIDPLVKQYPSLSPYNYVANNPVVYIDPDGQKIKAVNKKADDAIKVLYEKYYAFLDIRVSDDGVYSSKMNRYSIGSMENHIKEYNSFAKDRNKENKKYNKKHKDDDDFKARPILPLLSKDDAEEASQFLAILLKQEITEVQVSETSDGSPDFVRNNDESQTEGSRTGGESLVTNNGQYQKFYDALEKVGELNKPLADALYNGEATEIGYYEGMEFKKEKISIQADGGQNGNYAYFENKSEKRPSERNYTEGLLTVDGTGNSDAHNAQIILNAIPTD